MISILKFSNCDHLSIPSREAVPNVGKVGQLVDYLAIFDQPGIYKLKIGWRRALIVPIATDGEPDIGSDTYSRIQNKNPEFKFIEVHMPCCMLVRQWEFVDDAKDVTESYAIMAAGAVDGFGTIEYQEPDLESIAKEYLQLQEFVSKSQVKSNVIN